MSKRKSVCVSSYPEKIYPLHLNDEGYCGIALIFGMHQFESGCNTRKGALKECENLKSFAKMLSLKPCVSVDATAQNIRDILKCVAAPPKTKPPNIADDIWNARLLPTHNTIMIAISSHGKSSCFLTADEIEFPDSDIASYFNEDNCPLLRGKPKFTFFNKCRIMEENLYEKYYPPPEPSRGMEEFNESELPRDVEIDGTGEVGKGSFRKSSTNSNFFTINSCTMGTSSFRSSESGSLVISALPEAYKTYGRDRDISKFFRDFREQMLKETNEKVRNGKGMENATQCIETTETLTQDLIFPSPESHEEMMETESYQMKEEKPDNLRNFAPDDSVKTTETRLTEDKRKSKIKTFLHRKIRYKKAHHTFRPGGPRTRRNNIFA